MSRVLSYFLIASFSLPLVESGSSRTTLRAPLPSDIKEAWHRIEEKRKRREYPEVVADAEKLAAHVHLFGYLAAECELLSIVGGAQSESFQYRRAIQTFLRARACAERIRHSTLAAMISFNLSNIYFHLGAWREALIAANRADWSAALPTSAENSVALHLHRFRLAARLDGITATRRHLDKALHSAKASRSPKLLSLVYATAATEYEGAGDLIAAEKFARRATSLRRDSRDPLLSSSLLTLSHISLRQGVPHEALTLADEAFAELRRHRPQRPMFRFYQARGQALAATGQLFDARRDLVAAVEHLRPFRPDLLQSESIGIHASASHQEVFASLASVCNRLFFRTHNYSYLQEALQYALENRALALRTLQAKSEDPSPLYASLLATIQRAELQALRNSTPGALAALSEARLKIAEFQLASAQSKGDVPPPPTVARILETLPSDAAILVFQAGPEQSYLWSLARGRLHLSVLPSESDLRSVVHIHGQLIEQDNPRHIKVGLSLYRVLFSSLPHAVRKCRRWMILPDRFLFSVPYAALVTSLDHGRPRYLAEQKAIILSPFLGQHKPKHASSSTSTLAAFGDPIYNNADPRLATSRFSFRWPRWPSTTRTADDTIDLPRLPGTAQEIRAAAEAFQGRSRQYYGAQVTAANLRLVLASHPEVIHLATHLVPSPADRSESRLLLSLNSTGQPELLDPTTIASLRATCSLVVMTGCSAGAGASIASEGLLGLSRAWLAAGASSVLVTYWPMPDDSGELWRHFYAAWSSAALMPDSSKAGLALQSAQRVAIASDGWRAKPRYWGSFFVVGDQFLHSAPRSAETRPRSSVVRHTD